MSTYHHGDLRAALLDAASRVLEKEGPDAISLRDLARRADVSHNAPYPHFPDRRALGVAAQQAKRRRIGRAAKLALLPVPQRHRARPLAARDGARQRREHEVFARLGAELALRAEELFADRRHGWRVTHGDGAEQ